MTEVMATWEEKKYNCRFAIKKRKIGVKRFLDKLKEEEVRLASKEKEVELMLRDVQVSQNMSIT
jgi:hypothetical protein